MKYIFILGRNLALSKAEVFAFLKRFDYFLLEFFEKGNALLIDIDRPLKEKAIDILGGVIAIGEVLGKSLKDLDKINIYSGTKNKLNYCIWEFGENEDFRDYLKKRFRSEKVKAVEKKLTGKIQLQSGGDAPMVASSLVQEQYFIFSREVPEVKNEEFYFGKIIGYSDYESLEERDMKKPVRRSELAISPRLAKIMINLSLVKKGKLLDSFCGIGAILFEALLQGIKVIGIDIDKEAIEGAKENLKWGNFDQENYLLICGNSKKVSAKKAEVLVAEPDLGMTLKKVLLEDKRKSKEKIIRKNYSEEKAKEILEEFENLLVDVLNNFKKSISGRFVFSSPLIRTRKGRISCNIEKIQISTGLKLVEGFPIQEYRKGKIVGRDIFVVER
jgi:tRNA G10  N-methylase Trm11